MNHLKFPDILSRTADFIALFEGCRLTVYTCLAGCPTIGYGHRLKEGEVLDVIRLEEARQFLEQDVRRAIESVRRLSPTTLTPNQYIALASFIFNVGCGAYQRSQVRQQVNRGDHDDVPHGLLQWIWAGGRRSRGLRARRVAEGAMYRS